MSPSQQSLWLFYCAGRTTDLRVLVMKTKRKRRSKPWAKRLFSTSCPPIPSSSRLTHLFSVFFCRSLFYVVFLCVCSRSGRETASMIRPISLFFPSVYAAFLFLFRNRPSELLLSLALASSRSPSLLKRLLRCQGRDSAGFSFLKIRFRF